MKMRIQHVVPMITVSAAILVFVMIDGLVNHHDCAHYFKYWWHLADAIIHNHR